MRKRVRWSILVIVGSVVLMAAFLPGEGETGDPPIETFRDLDKAFSEAVIRGDAKAIAAMYTESGKLYPPGRVISGREEIEKYFTPARNRTQLDHSLEIEEIEIVGDVAIETGTWRSVTRPTDGDPFARSERYILVWKRDGAGQWRIDKDFWHRPQNQVTTQDAQPFVPERTEVRRLTSKTNGVEYEIYVALPHGYGEKGKRFPVVYTLDADYSFLIGRNIVDHLSERDHIEEIIVVGIAYGGPPQYRMNRTRDYTPTFVPDGGYGPEYQKVSGSAPKFLEFIESELIPFIEGEYAAQSTGRALVGHSYGGLFTTWAMLTRPGLFSRYVAVSPSLWYDDGLMFRLAESFAEENSSLDARVYFCVGSRESNSEHDMVGDMTKFVARLRSRKYKNLELSSRVMEDETHNSVYPGGLSNGLRFVFEGR